MHVTLSELRRLVREAVNEEKKKKTAVIIKGNPKFIHNNAAATKFYDELRSLLELEGFSVSFDAGKPYSVPKEADLWVGHSRGVDRLEFAPEGTMTVAMGLPGQPNVINHPDDDAAPGRAPSVAHFTLTQEMKDELLSRLKK
jgi:hypothetical protein